MVGSAAPPRRRLRGRHRSGPRVRRPRLAVRAGDPGGRRRVPRGERAARARRRPGETFRPTRDLGAKRDAFAAGAPSGRWGRQPRAAGWAPIPPRPIVPGERRYRDGDRIHHARWGDGIVVTSKLTRDDEEVTVAFRDPAVGRKTMLASLANLEITG